MEWTTDIEEQRKDIEYLLLTTELKKTRNKDIWFVSGCFSHEDKMV